MQNGADIATVAYDNICNLERLRATPFPLPPPLDMMWMSITKIINVFHFGNHVSPDCQRKYSPEHMKKLNPTWNTQHLVVMDELRALTLRDSLTHNLTSEPFTI